MSAGVDPLEVARLTAEDVERLEAEVRDDPRVLERRMSLAEYYAFHTDPTANGSWARERMRAHVLAIVGADPASDLAARAPRLLHPELDAEAWLLLLALWVRLTSDGAASAAVLGNAAEFLLPIDREVAGELVQRARNQEPANEHWADRQERMLFAAPGYAPPVERVPLARRALEDLDARCASSSDPLDAEEVRPWLARFALLAGDERRAARLLGYEMG